MDLPVTYVNMKVKVNDSLPPLHVRLQYELLRCLPHSVDLVFGEYIYMYCISGYFAGRKVASFEVLQST